MSKRKVPSSDNINHDFCDFLIELSEYEKNVLRNIHKSVVYRKAANVIGLHPTRIQSGEEAQKLQGVGAKIGEKIDEFLQTGKLKKLEVIKKDDTNQAITELTRVAGIGPAKAQELVKLGIRSIQDLERNKQRLTHHQQIGLQYVADFEKKIPRSEIEEIEAIIREELHKVDPEYLITICGSYRRGKLESGDVDVLITHPSFSSESKNKDLTAKLLKKVVDTLKSQGLITDSMSFGGVKFMGVCRVKQAFRRIDIRLTPCDQYHCAILYFTGSDLFNKEMRAHALTNGFTLNEYCLRPMGSTGIPGQQVKIESERDIFDYINFPYKKPSERG